MTTRKATAQPNSNDGIEGGEGFTFRRIAME